ncbi:hypothetical protein PCYB_003090 [Plasmodium cynomolgi strain B]|uniref:Uncharacterized protein n=1 Tax=Plasmodium cynomolgi (strain B) TaxID=1120755 RepID=K6V2R0_PLACD|nr:hypothetical protein PCYB_003090 [Plasmodium cynomolgi strain B]GAB69560.1 hypothetical protein PCYB_003090 [Plasmodium cynomolgi strain B]
MPDISFSAFRRDVTTNVGIGCLNANDDIEVELRHKISKLDSSNGTDDILQKCDEINKFLNEQKNVYNACYEHRHKQSLWYTPIIIKKILSESTKYHKCPQQWTSEPEEATELTVKEEESHDENEKPETQTSAENISEFPQNSALPGSSDSTPDFGTDQKTDRHNVSPAVEALPPNHSSSHDSQITKENSITYTIIKYINKDNQALPDVSDNHALGDTKFCAEIFDNVETADTYSYGDESVEYVTCELKQDDENPIIILDQQITLSRITVLKNPLKFKVTLKNMCLKKRKKLPNHYQLLQDHHILR